MNFTADIVRVMNLTHEEAELFLQKYGDWEVEILGKTVRGITPERLLSVGKCQEKEEWLGGARNAELDDLQRNGKKPGGRPRKAEKASLAQRRNKTNGNPTSGHDNVIPFPIEIRHSQVPN